MKMRSLHGTMKSNRDFQVASLPRIWAESFAGLGITLSVLKMYISLICVVNGLYKKENDAIIGEICFSALRILEVLFSLFIYSFLCVCMYVCVYIYIYFFLTSLYFAFTIPPFLYMQTKRIRLWHCKRQHSN